MARVNRTWQPPLGDEAALHRLILERRLSRRRFLLAAALGGTSAALAACAPPTGGGTSTPGPTGGGGGNLGDTLNLATWPNYHNEDALEAFTTETGVAVNVQVFGSTEEMEAKLRAGNSGLDLVVPSNYAVQGWIKDQLVEPLDYAKLPTFNRDDWNARFMDQEFDPGNQYSLPKNWGTTGIAYRSSKVTDDVRSWKQFFDLAGGKYSGRAVIVDHQISSIGSAAVALGLSFNAGSEEELAEVEAMLTALKPKLYAISSDVQPPLRNLDSWLTIAWTGDGVQVSRDNEDARYVVAEDGGELWIDSYTVAADAPHRDAAYAFLDFILQPDMAALETEFCLFPHANDKATAALPAEIRENEVIYPSPDLLEKLEYASSETYNSPLRAETWARIKASA
ncbi:MAG TPA: spermidine/putrescine ABC transporter substrate-binding protein [Vitreimonas sp.]|nr:spermidine/putrescine ABC transporter substrate-binding protein [Vitreimonas sp.]